jgi:hypothetical protein
MKNRACEKRAIVGPGEGALQVHQGVTKGLEHRKQGGGGGSEKEKERDRDLKYRGNQINNYFLRGLLCDPVNKYNIYV